MRSLIAIQEGQISLAQIKALEDMLRKTYAAHVSADKLTVIWNIAAKQHTITDRKWSRGSTVSVEVPDNFPTQRREAFMLELDRNWRAITGQHPDQLAIGAFDSTRYGSILKGNLERFSAFGRISYLSKMITRMLVSKMRHGVMITHFNQ